jgi:Tfp pilus assembly protein PilV
MNKKPTGFTLMETALALTLLTVGMLGLAGVFSQIVKSNSAIKQKQTAAFLAITKLAQLRSLPLTDIGELKGSFDEPFQHYIWQAKFSYRPDNNKLSDVQLDVKHKSGISVTLWTQIVIGDAQ